MAVGCMFANVDAVKLYVACIDSCVMLLTPFFQSDANRIISQPGDFPGGFPRS